MVKVFLILANYWTSFALHQCCIENS